MMMQRAWQWRKGVGLLWFVVVSIPVLFFSAGLSVDFTRLIVSKRQASNLAAAAAVAGAYQFEPGKPYLDPVRARSEAQRTWDYGRRAGDRNAARLIEPGESITVNLDTPVRPRVVTVEVEYKISNLLFIRYWVGQDTYDFKLQRSAFVCVPGDVGNPTEGFCTRPETSGAE